MSGFSSAGLRALRRMNRNTLDTDLVFYDGTTALASQRVAIRRLSQEEIPEGEAISSPGGVVEVRGTFDMTVKSGYRFTWDGFVWEVTQTPVATETNTSVARRAIAQSTGKAHD
jgi:hypothetical protein